MMQRCCDDERSAHNNRRGHDASTVRDVPLLGAGSRRCGRLGAGPGQRPAKARSSVSRDSRQETPCHTALRSV
jgi:hypothetical protein